MALPSTDIDFSKLPSSIQEFYTQEEYAAMGDYERMHLTRMRQNYEALKSFGLKPPIPEFMLRRKNSKRWKSTLGPVRNKDDSMSEDSDEEWTPACEQRKEDRAKPFVPIFRPPTKRKTGNASPRKARQKTLAKITKKPSYVQSSVSYSYTLRNRPMMKYMSLAVPDEDDFLYCEECNLEYPGDCPVHGPLLVVEDKVVSVGVKKGEDDNYNLHTLPDGLEVKRSTIPNAGLGVFATKRFPTRTRFGPYKGNKEKNEDMAHDSGYCWQIFQNGKPSHFVDAKDPKHSNWMRYVNCARSEDEQCLTAYQHEGDIYYRAHRDINVGTELLVYYGDNYAKELGIALQKVGQKLKTESHDIFPCPKCVLAFSTDLFLERHLHRLHQDEYWRRKLHVGSDGEAEELSFLDVTFNNCNQYMAMVNEEGSHEYGSAVLQTRMRIHSGEKLYKCTVCSKAFSDSSGMRTHMRIHSGEKPYKCTFCSKAFTRSGDMQTHMRIHSGENPYKCTVCSKSFSQSGTMRTHMRIHSGEKPYKCTVCSKAFSDSSGMRTHMRIHSGEKPYKCTFCSKAFTRSGDMQTHMRIHSGENPYKCTVCSKSFSQSGDMQTHMRIHSGENPYKCTVCSKSFSQSGDMQTHMRIHSGENPYKCTVCSKSFSQSGNMRTHMRIHSGEKPYKCTVCSKAFSVSCNMRTHMIIHSGEKPYKCTVCSRAFSDSSSMRTHMRIHSGEKPYKCTVCSKAFTQSGDMQTHMRIHSGEKPYKCTVCSKAFTRSGVMRTHMRIHSLEKPYKCTVCSKAFSDSSSMRTHMRIHSGEKPYKCTVCSKAFSQSGQLRTHTRVHSGEKPYKCTVCSKAFSQSGDMRKHVRIHSLEKPYKCTVCSKAFSDSSSMRTHMRIHSGEQP